MIKLARNIYKQRAKIVGAKCNIKLMLFFKKNNLASIFTRRNFAIRDSSYLWNKIPRQILEREIRNSACKEIEINSAAEREH